MILGKSNRDATKLKLNGLQINLNRRRIVWEFRKRLKNKEGEKTKRSPSVHFRVTRDLPTHIVARTRTKFILLACFSFCNVAKLSNTNTKLIKKENSGTRRRTEREKNVERKSLKHDKYAFELNNL